MSTGWSAKGMKPLIVSLLLVPLIAMPVQGQLLNCDEFIGGDSGSDMYAAGVADGYRHAILTIARIAEYADSASAGRQVKYDPDLDVGAMRQIELQSAGEILAEGNWDEARGNLELLAAALGISSIRDAQSGSYEELVKRLGDLCRQAAGRGEGDRSVVSFLHQAFEDLSNSGG